MIDTVFNALWFILPAYIANGSAVLLGGTGVIDMGQYLLRHRIFGDHKTISGFLGGVMCAAVLGFIMGHLQHDFESFFNITLNFSMSLYNGLIIGAGAMSGDLLGSFIKRRLEMKSGQMALGLDQLNFVFGAFIFSYFILGIIPTAGAIIFIIIITPILHLVFNKISYQIGTKKYPW